MPEQTIVPVETITATILTIRGQRVIIDADLARLYDTSTMRLNQAVKRNAARFPADFMFTLTPAEKEELITNCDRFTRLKHSSALPHAFTEHGAVMVASILNTPKAVEVSVFVVRAFIQQRAMLAANADLALKLERLERKLLASFTLTENRLDDHENQLEQIIEAIREMRTPAPPRRIGFRTGDDGKG